MDPLDLDDVEITVEGDTVIVEYESMTPALLRLLMDLGLAIPTSYPCVRFGLVDVEQAKANSQTRVEKNL